MMNLYLNPAIVYSQTVRLTAKRVEMHIKFQNEKVNIQIPMVPMQYSA